MNDVNLNSPDLKLVRPSEQAPARASVSPLAEDRNVPAQAALSPGSSVTGREPPVSRNSQPQAEQRARVIGDQEVGRAVSKLNDFVQSVQRDLQFEVDQELGKTVVKVVDQETQKVIRQIPDELALRLAENLQQDEPLTLFDLRV